MNYKHKVGWLADVYSGVIGVDLRVKQNTVKNRSYHLADGLLLQEVDTRSLDEGAVYISHIDEFGADFLIFGRHFEDPNQGGLFQIKLYRTEGVMERLPINAFHLNARVVPRNPRLRDPDSPAFQAFLGYIKEKQIPWFPELESPDLSGITEAQNALGGKIDEHHMEPRPAIISSDWQAKLDAGDRTLRRQVNATMAWHMARKEAATGADGRVIEPVEISLVDILQRIEH